MQNQHDMTTGRFQHWPARLDLIQGVSGLLLVLFMWTHMFMVSSILLSKDAMYYVARMFEGEPLLGKPYPVLVSIVAATILLILVVHTVAAIRKIPSSYREYRDFRNHAQVFRHTDTNLWLLQLGTGFVLIFFTAAHLYQMLVHPADIGPYASADRVWSGRWWPLYLVLLFAAEVHGGIGIYRLALKWGWFTNPTGRTNRRKLQGVVCAIVLFFLTLGLLTLAAEMKVGYEHRHRVGERYVPAVEVAPVNPTPDSGGEG